MAIAKHARGAAAIHGVLQGVGVGPLALGAKLLLAIHTVAAGNLKGSNDAVAFLQTFHSRTHRVYFAAELVAEDVAFLELDDGA